ncbi:hypothetical protein M433DRAFT_156470 [Acidomyces richmondensis BFW]|nr:hypothetical protein M433DRAFT_156470 [Acidomyces richmondensis BFW]
MMSPTPRNLPLNRNDTHPGVAQSTSKQDSATGSNEIPLLDFLYPPQALAQLARMNCRNWEKWEKRNARRLPDGYVPMTTGNASRAYNTNANAKAEMVHEMDEYRYMLESATEKESDDNGDLQLAEKVVAHRGYSPEIEHKMISSTEYVDTSGSLAGESPSSIESLFQIMRKSRQSGSRLQPESNYDGYRTVLRLYDGLDNKFKDVRLKIELLDWLSAFPDNDAEVRCTQLYKEIPESSRTLGVYKASLTVLLRRGRHVQAFNLLKEALANIQNGDEVVKAFLQYAIERKSWQLAINIETIYRQFQSHRTKRSQDSRFWFLVSSLPNLLPKAMALLKHLRFLNAARTANDQVRLFCANFFKEALVQKFLAYDDVDTEKPNSRDEMPKLNSRQLFETYLKPLGDEVPKLYEDILRAIVNPESKHPYSPLHRVVSLIYLQLSATEGYVVPEDLLMMLLDRLTAHWLKFEKKRELHHSLHVNRLTDDWIRYHGRVSKNGVKQLLTIYARSGQEAHFTRWFEYLNEHYAGYGQQKDVLWTRVYLYARRIHLPKAKAAFEDIAKMAAEHGESPSLRSWNVLLHAYSRQDDLDGAVGTLAALVDQGVKPDHYSFHPLMTMTAKRGDVDGVMDLLGQFDALTGQKRWTAFYGSLILAHTNRGQIEKAMEILETAISEASKGNVLGELTGCFNIVLTACALRRDIDTMRTVHRRMKDAGVRADAETYAAIVQALVLRRLTNAADSIVRSMLRRHGIMPTAFHYAVVMAGFNHQGRYDRALAAHRHMKSLKIKSTLSSNVALLKAKAMQESRQKGTGNAQRAAEPLAMSLQELERTIQLLLDKGDDVADKQPQAGLHGLDNPSRFSAAYFAHLVHIHGKRKCLDSVHRLIQRYKRLSAGVHTPGSRMPIVILSAVMNAYLNSGDYNEVEVCWKMAKEQADEFTKRVPIPQLEKVADILEIQCPQDNDAQEVGFAIAPVSEATKNPPRTGRIVTKGTYDPPASRPVPGRAQVLTRCLRIYLYALGQQNRISDMISVVASVLSQGYVMDSRTWNIFICLLCEARPTLALLAFTLTERFLIHNFPGWEKQVMPWPLKPSVKAQGVEHFRGGLYMPPDTLMPRYATLVKLGAALLELRRIEAVGKRNGGINWGPGMAGMEKYVGTIKLIRKHAPKTLFAVQSMPTVQDRLQSKLLRGE